MTQLQSPLHRLFQLGGRRIAARVGGRLRDPQEWPFRALCAILFAGLILGLGSAQLPPTRAVAQSKELRELDGYVRTLYSAGKYAEAIPLAQELVQRAEKELGESHAGTANFLNILAILYGTQGRYGEAERLYKRALAIGESALGPDHPDVGGRLNNLANLYRDQGRFDEAEPLYKRALAITEKVLGSDHPLVGGRLNNLAALYRNQGRYGEAEPLYKRALAIGERALGPNHPNVAGGLNNLANLYRDQGRFGEAEPLYKRALAIGEKTLGADHPGVGTWLNNLALLYETQGRHAEAESLYRRALVIGENALGPDHPDVGIGLNNLANLFGAQGRYGEAEPLYKRALAITEKALGPDHPDVGSALNNLANLYGYQSHHGEAEALYKRALAIAEKALGPSHPDVGRRLTNLANLYRDRGRYGEAEPLYKRALAIGESALGPDHPDVGTGFYNLAGLYFLQHGWVRAADYLRISTGLTVRRTQRGMDDVGQAPTGKKQGEAQQSSHRFWALVKAVHRLAVQDRNANPQFLGEMFQAAQWVQASGAAQSLAQMAARSAKGDAKLAAMIRERQDLVGEWQKRDQVHSASIAHAPNERNRSADAGNVARLAAIDARIAAIDQRLKAEFPDYAALSRPEPLSIAEVQAELGRDEALVLVLDTPEWKPTPEESFIWVATKTEARWARSELGREALGAKVAALRQGIECRAAGQPAREGACSPWQLPFKLDVAYDLYERLLEPVAELLAGKQHLIVVLSGALTSLPFHLLVTEKPLAAVPEHYASYRDSAWLIKRHAITVLPSVSSLKALRVVAKAGRADKPYVGFGDPVFSAPAGVSRPLQPKRVASTRAFASYFKGRLADREALGLLDALPETAVELKEIARTLGVPETEIFLRERATETMVKHTSLDRYRIVHFATHGLIAGELQGVAEPALAFTVPAEASEFDDGLLTASEAAQLKLNADWVILSACNTAAGDKPGAEALSGLARAFFYAGARALLVSHWPVETDAAVKLTTRTLTELKANPGIGRAEALRRAMLALMSSRDIRNAHPALWGPFTVVGEGGARQER